eukprot:530272_1
MGTCCTAIGSNDSNHIALLDDSLPEGPSCDGSSNNCSYLKKLASTMRDYASMTQTHIEQLDIHDVLNSFLHSIVVHDNDIEDELFDACSLKKCQIFARNQRDRRKKHYDVYSCQDDHLIAKIQILEKIHCYYTHRTDIGYALTQKEAQLVRAASNQCRYESEARIRIDPLWIAMHEILSPKHAMCRNIRGEDRAKKFNRFVSIPQYNDMEEAKDLDVVNFSQMYDYGFEFEYDKVVVNHMAGTLFDRFIGYVEPFYSTFKEELTSKLTMEQFNAELQKAMMHFASHNCKTSGRAGPVLI